MGVGAGVSGGRCATGGRWIGSGRLFYRDKVGSAPVVPWDLHGVSWLWDWRSKSY